MTHPRGSASALCLGLGARRQEILSAGGSTSRPPHGRLSAARGAFLGLSLSTQSAELARAVLEGVALEMRWMLSAFHAFGLAGRSLHLTGGGTRSGGWCQVVANATQVPVVRVPDPELGLRGAAFYALAAGGVFGSATDAARALNLSGDLFTPDTRLADRYAEAADLYRLTRSSFRDSGIDQRLFAAAGVG